MVSSLSSSFTLTQTHQLVPIHYSLFLLFSPPKLRQHDPSLLSLARENVRRAVVAKLSATRHEEPRAKTTLTETAARVRSSSSPRRDDRRYERKRATSSPADEKEGEAEKENGKKGPKKTKADPREVELRIGLDMCSKRGDVKRAIELFDWAKRQGIRLGQYHYNVLLYLCSSAAAGVIRPAKSGSAARTLTGEEDEGQDEIRVDDELRKHARKRGYEIFESMRSDEVEMSEAALTSVARMAGDGDSAFEAVSQMKSLGIAPKLRSYGPALSSFCNSGDIEKAFAVEAHMVENGVCPEEPELQALLRLSVSAGDPSRVYDLLHKLRAAVRKVSPQTSEIIGGWFAGKAASRVGKRWDAGEMRAAVAAGGGGWHGLGWVGRGTWSMARTTVGTDNGLCRCCGQKLEIIDLDPQETESFAESVASIATQRDKHFSFPKFQKWLDYYGPFEAVVDGANVGLFSQKRFMPSKINAVVNGIRQNLPSKKWPLIVLHNRRVDGPKMNEPFNRALVEKWRNADAIYPTPTGSNDDWYWLYAAIKFKSYLVTNDEMRDHTFQLLGNDFFPRWKERHQVRFTFTDAGPEFLMPPPYSVVIQESENGHWHIPISSEEEHEAKRPWLCVTRSSKSRLNKRPKSQVMGAKARGPYSGNHEPTNGESGKSYKRLRDILSGSMNSIIPNLESSEEISGCAIDFQI